MMEKNLVNLLSKWDSDDAFFDSFESLSDPLNQRKVDGKTNLSTRDAVIPNSSLETNLLCGRQSYNSADKKSPFKSSILKRKSDSGEKNTDSIALRETTNLTPTKPFSKQEEKKAMHISSCNKILSKSNSLITVKKRKFPGPAGLLPSLGEVQFSTAFSPEKRPSSPQNVCSQSSVQEFEAAWSQMLLDLLFVESDHDCPLSNFNIKWILRRSVLRGQSSLRKVPFLVVMIKALDLNHLDATATFLDRTGEMNGTIAADVIERYLPSIRHGSVLVMKDVTVLSPGSLRPGMGITNQRKSYLNITLNSLIRIYSNDDGSIDKTCIIPFNNEALANIVSNFRETALSVTIVEEEQHEINKSSYSANGDASHTNANKLNCLHDDSAPKVSRSNFPISTRAPLPSYKKPTFQQASPASSFRSKPHDTSSRNSLSHTSNSLQHTSLYKNSNPNFKDSRTENTICQINGIKDSQINLVKGDKFSPVECKFKAFPKPTIQSNLKNVSISEGIDNEQCLKDKPYNDVSIFDDIDDDLDEIMATIDVDSLL